MTLSQINAGNVPGPETGQQHSLLEGRQVAVNTAAAQVVDKGQMFGDVGHWPATEEAVQQALVPS